MCSLCHSFVHLCGHSNDSSNLSVCTFDPHLRFFTSDSEVRGVFHRTQHHGHAHNADKQTSWRRYGTGRRYQHATTSMRVFRCELSSSAFVVKLIIPSICEDEADEAGLFPNCKGWQRSGVHVPCDTHIDVNWWQSPTGRDIDSLHWKVSDLWFQREL